MLASLYPGRDRGWCLSSASRQLALENPSVPIALCSGILASSAQPVYPRLVGPSCRYDTASCQSQTTTSALIEPGAGELVGRCCDIAANCRWRVIQGHFTVGGKLDRIASTLPPVLRPNVVPRS